MDGTRGDSRGQLGTVTLGVLVPRGQGSRLRAPPCVALGAAEGIEELNRGLNESLATPPPSAPAARAPGGPDLFPAKHSFL